MEDLRKTISDAAKKMWANLPEEEKLRRLSKGGKKGGKTRWQRLTVKERRELIAKMNRARLAKKKIVC
jgi:hypothetical protein